MGNDLRQPAGVRLDMIHRTKAFTLIEIMIVVAIIGIITAIAIPGFLNARDRARQNSCQENLLRIDGAMQQYIMDQNLLGTEDLSPFWPAEFVGNGLYIRALPVCPAGGSYILTFADAAEAVTCTTVNARYPHVLPHVLASGS
jgi:prepilin-type N-terminal cleavage/methylation domain-containing protein